MRLTYRIHANTPTEAILFPGSLSRFRDADAVLPFYLQDFTALKKGAYPIFNQYPTYIVNYRTQMKEKIRREEAEYLRRR